MVGIKPRFSAKVASALNNEAISPALKLFISFEKVVACKKYMEDHKEEFTAEKFSLPTVDRGKARGHYTHKH